MKPVKFKGNYPSPVGRTNFGYFDQDPKFIEDAPKVASWIAGRLGWPTVDLEITVDDLYQAFEEAITEFSSHINDLNIRDNLVTLQGQEKIAEYENLTDSYVTGTPTQEWIRLTKNYGSQVGHGGDVKWRRDYFVTEPGKQDYNLQDVVDQSRGSLPPESIAIKRIYHYPIPAIHRRFGYYSTTGDTRSLLDEFDFDGFSVASWYLMQPAYHDLLETQAIEMDDHIYRSAYQWILRADTVRIFPIPRVRHRIWFEYAFERELGEAQIISGDVRGVISDYSNAPYHVIPYEDMNGPSKRWIYKYALAVAKHKLGTVRSKFDSVPTPNDQFNLDGDSLKSEANDEKQRLVENLKEKLDRLSRSNQLERQAKDQENLQQNLNKIPTRIYTA
jgi:hypothetical protein